MRQFAPGEFAKLDAAYDFANFCSLQANLVLTGLFRPAGGQGEKSQGFYLVSITNHARLSVQA
jgi:hypothetical protein